MNLNQITIPSKNVARAIEFYEKFLGYKSDDTEVLTNLASCYAQLGHYESAKIGYRAVLTIDPTYFAAKKHLEVLGENYS